MLYQHSNLIFRTMQYFLLVLFTCLAASVNAQVYNGKNGSVKLVGKAPQETVTAESRALVGKIDVATKSFIFRQSLTQFKFSQGDLQKKDAEEIYWETDKYPAATFTGKIINDVDLKADGVYRVNAVGVFSMHGVEKEMKIPATLTVSNGSISVSSQFRLFLSDFKIKVPRLVVMKVSEEFQADIALALTKK
jgi:hypothetical protein